MQIGWTSPLAQLPQAFRRADRPSVPVGYDPTAIDASLRVFLAEAERAINHVRALSGILETALTSLCLPGELGLAEANTLTTIHERQTKAALNLVKALDELTRLRSFLAGGPDSRADLTVMGDIELRGLVMKAVADLGMKVVPLDAEVIEG